MSARLVILPSLNGPQPQIWYGPPFVGCAEQKPIEMVELPPLKGEMWDVDAAVAYATQECAA